jgi:hypothetical protein
MVIDIATRLSASRAESYAHPTSLWRCEMQAYLPLLPEKYRRISKARYRESVEIGKRKVNSHYQNRSE